jgi:cob(I)alamin adenosyltransferase
MKIYTRTGDKGQTSLVDGTRVSKASDRVETYGTVDELNSVIGVVLAQGGIQTKTLHETLETIQHDLFAIGAVLADQQAKPNPKLAARVTSFEKQIDALTKELPPLKQFILPGGGGAGAMLHLARTICRRAERRIVALSYDEAVDEHILQYFNRLSDLLFTLARYSNQQENKQEIFWKK